MPDATKSPALLSVLFLGSKRLGLGVLKEICAVSPGSLAAIATLDDSRDERGCLTEFRSFARTADAPLEVLAGPSGLGALLDRYRPGLVLVCGWYWKIPPETLAKAPAGFVGLHASLLPRYRGFAPLVWSLLRSESRAGISLFYMEDGLDTGDILSRKSFRLGPDATIAEALDTAEGLSLEAIRETLPLLLAGAAPRLPQDHSQASYCSQRRPEDGLLDWRAAAPEIHNAVRAQTRPYPGAFTFLEGRKLFVWKTRRFAADYHGIPGLVAESRAGEAVVTCGQGALILVEAQLEGQEPRPAGEILRFGTRLG